MLKANGYQTALIGKWHLGAIDPEYHPNRRGFDEFIGFRGGWNDYYNYHVEHNGTPLPCDGTYITDLFSDAAADYIRGHADAPFFLHLTYNAPHFPLQAPEAAVKKYMDTGKYNAAVSKLYAMIEVMDQGIGRVLATLDEAGVAENTIVVFASDNGPDMGGEGESCQKRFNCQLRAEKMYAYEGGIRVPAVVRYPKAFAPDTRCEALVHGADWFPTLLSLCGVPVPETLNIDGMDVSGVLSGKEKMGERTLFWQWCRYVPEIDTNAAARVGDQKLVHAPEWAYLDLPAWEVDIDVDIKYHPENHTTLTDKPVPQRPPLNGPKIELYDLKSDPLETKDLAAERPQTAEALEKRLQTWFDEVERDRLK